MKSPIDSPGSIRATEQEDKTTSTPRTNSNHPPALYLDYARYERYLEGSDLDDAQKQAFLDALWQIIVSFVDLGFGVHPLQQPCGEKAQTDNIIKTWRSACAKFDKTFHPIAHKNTAGTMALAEERSPE